MKAVIFAGGIGTRLWPLSRKKLPKQFEKIIGDKSTLELAVERLLPEFKPEDIYVSTGSEYTGKVAELLPFIPQENIIGEPEKKDVGPAVGLAISLIHKTHSDEPVVILWSDHLVKHDRIFKHIILTSGMLVQNDPNRIVFIGQKPRFASENLGWIETGDIQKTLDGVNFREFTAMKYRPDEQTAREYFQQANFCWNLGYFVSTPRFLMDMFREFAPDIYRIARLITQNGPGAEFRESLAVHYHEMPEINFDKAVLENLKSGSAYVVMEDIGWSDVGAWEALKEALAGKKSDTVTKGNVLVDKSYDSLVYNFQDDKLVVAVDLEDIVVVNTRDVILVGKKSTSSKIKGIVESFAGTEREKYT
ncbi:MAG: sugar phosphate nucleotidyltransferase [Patescibacteria group bacterium]|nr:sugar phosphate nucleotidyltransferase [Patescibacteria group bacterium]